MSAPISTDGTWSFRLSTRLVAGAGSVAHLGGLAAGYRRAFVVTDPGVAAAGHADTVEASLHGNGIETARFESVHANPSAEDVNACLAALRGHEPDLVVAVGGGSSIDAAKGAILLDAGGGKIEEYWVAHAEPRVPERPLLPLIAVPTTAGTGSEVQSFALVADPKTHAKMACGHPGLAPRTSILDPDLTKTQPFKVAACTALDALTHALEAAVTRSASSLSSACAQDSFVRIMRHLPAILARKDDSADREGMLVAAALAGLAIENGMLGAAHSMANPITAAHDVPHGQAVATALPQVLRFNAAEERVARRYQELALAAGLVESGASVTEAVDGLIRGVQDLLQQAGFPLGFGALGVDEAEIPQLAAGAAKQWTARFNPREVTHEDFESLYRLSLVP